MSAAALLTTGLTVAGHATTVVVLVVVGAVLAASLHWPDCGLSAVVLTAVLLPFAVLPMDLGLKPSLLNVAVGLVLVRWAVAGIRGELEPTHLFSVAPTLLFALLYTAAVFWGFNFETPSAFELRKTAEYLMGLMLFPVALTTLTTVRRIRIVATALAVGGTVAALAALFLYFVPRTAAADILGSLAVFDYPEGHAALRYLKDNPLEGHAGYRPVHGPQPLGCSVRADRRSPAALPLPVAVAHGANRGRPGLGRGDSRHLPYYSRNALLAIGTIGLFLAVFRHRILLPAGGGLALLLVLLPQTQGYVRRLAEGFMGRDLATRMRLTEYTNGPGNRAGVALDRHWFLWLAGRGPGNGRVHGLSGGSLNNGSSGPAAVLWNPAGAAASISWEPRGAGPSRWNPGCWDWQAQSLAWS